MFFILLGIAGCIGLIWFAIERNWNENFSGTIAVIVLAVGLVIGLFVPIAGYNEPIVVEEKVLVSLTDNTVSTGNGGVIYVNIDASNVYTYRFEVDSKYATKGDKAYESDTKSGDSVTVVEGDSYTSAKLVTYKLKPKRFFWTFAIGASEYEYVFYVPTGTVKGNIVLD